jgi:hypothetical protein
VVDASESDREPFSARAEPLPRTLPTKPVALILPRIVLREALALAADDAEVRPHRIVLRDVMPTVAPVGIHGTVRLLVVGLYYIIHGPC